MAIKFNPNLLNKLHTSGCVQAAMWWGGGPCDFSVSPSPFGLDFKTLDFGTSDSGLTIKVNRQDFATPSCLLNHAVKNTDCDCMYMANVIELDHKQIILRFIL